MNLKGQALKKWMSELLKERYKNHELIIERVSHSITTDKDIQDFARVVVDLYEMGYLKCLNDYKGKLQELGIGVSVIPEKKP
jgi:hypothetical protein